jgi:integrase
VVGFHTLRHTFASLMFERGANAKQVQRLLGHHSASFTLDTYVHLLSDDLGEPLALGELLRDGNANGNVPALAGPIPAEVA